MDDKTFLCAVCQLRTPLDMKHVWSSGDPPILRGACAFCARDKKHLALSIKADAELFRKAALLRDMGIDAHLPTEELRQKYGYPRPENGDEIQLPKKEVDESSIRRALNIAAKKIRQATQPPELEVAAQLPESAVGQGAVSAAKSQPAPNLLPYATIEGLVGLAQPDTNKPWDMSGTYTYRGCTFTCEPLTAQGEQSNDPATAEGSAVEPKDLRPYPGNVSPQTPDEEYHARSIHYAPSFAQSPWSVDCGAEHGFGTNDPADVTCEACREKRPSIYPPRCEECHHRMGKAPFWMAILANGEKKGSLCLGCAWKLTHDTIETKGQNAATVSPETVEPKGSRAMPILVQSDLFSDVLTVTYRIDRKHEKYWRERLLKPLYVESPLSEFNVEPLIEYLRLRGYRVDKETG